MCVCVRACVCVGECVRVFCACVHSVCVCVLRARVCTFWNTLHSAPSVNPAWALHIARVTDKYAAHDASDVKLACD